MISWLTGEQTAAFNPLATEAVAMGLNRVVVPQFTTVMRPGGIRQMAAGIRFAGIPAGLAVLRQDLQHDPTAVRLLSLAVTTPLRQLGLARDLLSWLRGQAPLLGWRSLGMSYPLNHACTAAMKQLTLSKEGWQQSDGMQLVHLDRQGGAELLHRLAGSVAKARCRGRFDLLAWGELPERNRQELGPALQAPKWAWPADDNGQDPLQSLDIEISTVLLDAGQPAGWLMAHLLGPRLFRVSQWWVKPDLQSHGAALLLLHRAIEGALASPIGYTMGSFGMELANTLAIRLCARKILPVASGISQQRHVQLEFS
jgi:hypothetical protein